MTAQPKRDPEAELEAAIASFRHDPIGFVVFAFPWGEEGTELADEQGPRTWQREVMDDVGAALLQGDVEGALRIAVASGHGIGKSALVSWMLLWALCTFPQTKATITANTGDQLRTKTWPEVAKWYQLLICKHWFVFEATSISAKGSRAKTWRCDAVTWSENNTSAFAGLHNKGKRLVLVFDEASEIADKVWEVAQGALTDKDTELIWLAFGNPTINTGRFRECFAGGRFAHRWRQRQIDSRTVDGTDTVEIAQWAVDWGEDSDFFRVRVKGQFPRGGSMQFIDGDRLTWPTACRLPSPIPWPMCLMTSRRQRLIPSQVARCSPTTTRTQTCSASSIFPYLFGPSFGDLISHGRRVVAESLAALKPMQTGHGHAHGSSHFAFSANIQLRACNS